MNYQEKNAWACGVAILVAFVPYFSVTLRYPMAFAGLFVVAVTALVVLLVLFHLINAIASRSIRKTGTTPRPDEMDRRIELGASKLAGLILGVVVLGWIIIAMFGAPIAAAIEVSDAQPGADVPFAIPVGKALLWVQVLFAGFVFANLAYYARIIVSYRTLGRG